MGDLLKSVHDVTQVLRSDSKNWKHSIRVLDHYAATTIASYAGIRMSDVNGNPSEAYWKYYELNPDTQCGLLMNASTVEKVMVELMNKMIEKHQEALLQINDDVAVCTWLMTFKKKWEDEYRNKTPREYDIAPPVLSVMQEAVQKTDKIFQTHAQSIAPRSVREWFLVEYEKEESKTESMLPISQAVIRFYFRHAHLAHYMCAIAGKIWKLQEVCDKPGAFPSTKQQNLLQKQLQDAISNLVVALNSYEFDLPAPDERFLYSMDHKTYQPQP
jgi:hypothetical protein